MSHLETSLKSQVILMVYVDAGEGFRIKNRHLGAHFWSQDPREAGALRGGLFYALRFALSGFVRLSATQ